MDGCFEAIGRPINIGVNQEISIYQLAVKVMSKTNSKSEIRFIPYDQAYERGFEDMERRVPNNTLLKSLTGWVETRNIDDVVDSLSKSILKEWDLMPKTNF